MLDASRRVSGPVFERNDGVWLVDFAPVSVPELLAQTIANVLGVREGPQRPARDALTEALRHRELLLVLDNCEHLIETCADLVATLLLEAAGLRVVATSREALGVSGETVFRVPGHRFRARGAQRGWRLDLWLNRSGPYL